MVTNSHSYKARQVPTGVVIIAVLAIILFYAVNNYIWLKISFPIPASPNEAFHFRYLTDTYSKSGENTELVQLKALFSPGSAADPLYIFLARLCNFQKRNFTAVKMANIGYFIILLIAVYNLGKYLKDKRTGLLAVAILSFYPAVYGSSRLFCEEFALMAAVALSILFLLKADYFRNRKYSLLFGLSSGMGIMLKYPFMLFVAGPFVYIFLKAISNHPEERKKILLNFMFSAILLILIISPRYWNLNLFINKIFLDPFVEGSKKPWVNAFDNLKLYTLHVMASQLGDLFLFLFLVSIYFFIKYAKTAIKIPFLLWIFIPWVFIVLMPHNKQIRFFIPYLPAVALVSAFGIALLKRKIIKIAMVSLLLTAGLIQYYAFSFGIEAMPGLGISKFPYFPDKICYRPLRGEAFTEIIPYINEKAVNPGKALLLIPPMDISELEADTWNCFFWFNGRGMHFKSVVLKNDHNFLPELMASIKVANFMLYSGDLAELETGAYIDKKIEEQRFFLRDHHFSERLVDFEKYLHENYPQCKDQFIGEVSGYKIAKSFYSEEGQKIYLFERNP